MRSLCLVAAVLINCFSYGINAEAADKALLQATAQMHLEEIAVDGAIVHLDNKNGDFIELYASQNHPMVFQLDNRYALCADLTTANGERRTIDIYITKDNDRLKVTQTIIGDRGTLKAMIAQGRATRLK